MQSEPKRTVEVDPDTPAGRELAALERLVQTHVPYAVLSPFGTQHIAHVLRAIQQVSYAATQVAPTSAFYSKERHAGLQLDRLLGPLPLEVVQHAAAQPAAWWQTSFAGPDAVRYWPLFVRVVLWRAGLESVPHGHAAAARAALHQAALTLYVHALAPLARYLCHQLATGCVFDMDTRLCRTGGGRYTAALQPPSAMRDMLHEQLRALGGDPLHCTMDAVPQSVRDSLPLPDRVTQATLCGVALGQLDAHVPHAHMEHLLQFAGPPRVLSQAAATALQVALENVHAEHGPMVASVLAAAAARAGEGAWHDAGNDAHIGPVSAEAALELTRCLADLRAYIDPEMLMDQLWRQQQAEKA